jgi:glycosyltransferase involved in cell wall biosynthesis
VAGCAADLVKENWNGLLIPPKDVSSLASAMKSLASQPDLCALMGARSARHISDFSPAKWSDGIARAIETVGTAHG